MEECIFCKIIKKEVESKLVKETENFIVIEDINPQAAIHLLIIPKKHIKDITEIDEKLWKEIKDISLGIAKSGSLKGFRLIHNAGDSASIPHMQVHFLSDVRPT